MLPTIYYDNINVLNERIENDSKAIVLMFNDFKRKFEKKKVVEKKMENQTNYTIRERENEREIKVRVGINGKLEDLIKQDS